MNAECEPLRERLSEYVDGALPQDSRDALEAHLAGCADCREELGLLRRVVRAVGGIPVCPAPDGFAARVVRRIARVSAARHRSRVVRLWFKALPVAAMFLVTVAATFVVHRNGLFQTGQEGPTDGRRPEQPARTVAVPDSRRAGRIAEAEAVAGAPVARSPRVRGRAADGLAARAGSGAAAAKMAVAKEMEERAPFVPSEREPAEFRFTAGPPSEVAEATSVPAAGEGIVSGAPGPVAGARAEEGSAGRIAARVAAAPVRVEPRDVPAAPGEGLYRPSASTESRARGLAVAHGVAAPSTGDLAVEAVDPEGVVAGPMPDGLALGRPPVQRAEALAPAVRLDSQVLAAAQAAGAALPRVSRRAGEDDDGSGREANVAFQQVPAARVGPHQVLTVHAEDPVDLVRRAVELANANELTPTLELTTEGALGLQLDVPQTRYRPVLRQFAAIAPPERQDLRNSSRARGAYFTDRLNDYALFTWIASPDAQESVRSVFGPPSPAAGPLPAARGEAARAISPEGGAVLSDAGMAGAPVVEQEAEVRLEIVVRRVSAAGR